MNEIDLTINKIAQGKINFDDGMSWFDALGIDGKKEAIRHLMLFISQAHPDRETLLKGLEDAPIKKTMTPVVLLQVNEDHRVALQKIKALPDEEIRKSFITLVSVFREADKKRRETWCKNGCTHEWHNL